MTGYAGRIASIDLTRGETKIEKLDEAFARRYLGGNGFAGKIIYDDVPPHAEPFSRENIVVFAQGPVNGAPFWGSNRGLVASISPATGSFFDSVYGGDFAWAMKQAGWDVVSILGESPTPVYIVMDTEAVRIEPAGNLWGLEIEATIDRLRTVVGPGCECAAIGPAGEHRNVTASIICSGKRLSAAGRGGLGAVLGSKRCKALVAVGKRPSVFHDTEAVKTLFGSMKPGLMEKAAALNETGTPILVNMINGKGMLCTRNNSRETFEGAEKISGELIRDRYKKRNIACRGCGIACGKMVSVPAGHYEGRLVKMPEYETLYALGSMLENDDIVSIFNANARCDELGLDTISFGVSLAFLIECAEYGYIGEEGLHFGAQDALAQLVEESAYGSTDVGKLLAMGSAKAAEYIGHDSKRFLYEVKGLEIAGHSARGLRMMGISYAVSPRGGSHHDGRPLYRPDDPDTDSGFAGAAMTCLETFNNATIGDSLVLCRFIQERTFGYSIHEAYAELIRSCTGWDDYSVEEVAQTAERICTIERQIAVDRGFDRTHDTLPERVRTMPVPQGRARGRLCTQSDLDALLDEYYRLRNWNINGRPSEATLAALKIRS